MDLPLIIFSARLEHCPSRPLAQNKYILRHSPLGPSRFFSFPHNLPRVFASLCTSLLTRSVQLNSLLLVAIDVVCSAKGTESTSEGIPLYYFFEGRWSLPSSLLFVVVVYHIRFGAVQSTLFWRVNPAVLDADMLPWDDFVLTPLWNTVKVFPRRVARSNFPYARGK